MKKLIIDNTRKSGNFFDNINNNNFIVEEYDICDDGKIKQTDNSSALKYNYINDKSLHNFINDKYEKIFNEKNNELFKMSASEYDAYKEFTLNHRKCIIDHKTGLNKFGAIGGGIAINYMINYNFEDSLPFVTLKSIKCLYCEKELQLTNTKCKNYFDYNEYLNYYIPKFNKVEFYRFMEIYNEFKKPLTIQIIHTGIGILFSIIVDDFIFDITNMDNW